MARIFISYKRVDKVKVFKIKNQIESALGEKCWIDLDGIESDAQFKNVIIKAINECEVVLFMYSKAHSMIVDFEKDWTVRELNFASNKNKRIVFINIDGSPLTDLFVFDYGTKQQVDATLPGPLEKLKTDLSKWLNITANHTYHNKNTVNGIQLKTSRTRSETTNIKTTEYPGVVIENGVLKKVPEKFKGHFVIGNEVKSIGDWAFSNCYKLSSVTIPNSVTSIGEYAFGYCGGLTSVTIPNSVKRIECEAFYFCDNLTSVTIPNSVTSIGDDAFMFCDKLTNVTLPNSVTSIGEDAFDCCTSLKRINVPKGAKERFKKMLDKDLWNKIIEQ